MWQHDFLNARIAEEDWEGAAAQRDVLYQTLYCAKRVSIGEKMALEAHRRECIEFSKSGLTREEWRFVRRRRMMEIGVIPYDLIRWRSPFKS